MKVRANEFRDLDPNDLPAVGDYVLLKSRAHRLVEVTRSRSHPGTVRYRAVITRLEDVPSAARTFPSQPNIRYY
jgi:hypothetical protein